MKFYYTLLLLLSGFQFMLGQDDLEFLLDSNYSIKVEIDSVFVLETPIKVLSSGIVEYPSHKMLDGVWEYYYENRVLAFRGKYLNGNPTGIHYYYNQKGVIDLLCYYDEKGVSKEDLAAIRKKPRCIKHSIKHDEKGQPETIQKK